jgi:hypothetical protein
MIQKLFYDGRFRKKQKTEKTGTIFGQNAALSFQSEQFML